MWSFHKTSPLPRILLTLFPCSRVGSLRWEIVCHELPKCASFPEATVLPCILQHGLLSRVTGPARSLLQCGLSESQLQSHFFKALLWSLPRTASGIPFHCGTPWAVAAQLPHRGLHQSRQGNLCSSTRGTSCSFFCTDLDVYSAVSPAYSHLPLTAAVGPWVFNPFLNMLA